jgi:hypothetical protein
MARARNIKPALFKNELLGTADMALTVLFTGLWTLADREGRLEDRPLRIKAEIFPYREGLDINGYLTELERLEFIDRYTVDGVNIIQVRTFSVHQNPHKTEKASELPAKPVESSSCAITVKAPLKNDGLTEPAVLIPDSLITDSLVLIPDPLITDSPPKKASAGCAADFLKHLVEHHGYDEIQLRTKVQNTRQAKQWHEDHVTLQELDDAVALSRQRLSASNDDRAPPVTYLAKVLASNRQSGKTVTAGINVQSGFTPQRYAIDERTAKRYKIAGGEA